MPHRQPASQPTSQAWLQTVFCECCFALRVRDFAAWVPPPSLRKLSSLSAPHTFGWTSRMSTESMETHACALCVPGCLRRSVMRHLLRRRGARVASDATPGPRGLAERADAKEKARARLRWRCPSGDCANVHLTGCQIRSRGWNRGGQ